MRMSSTVERFRYRVATLSTLHDRVARQQTGDTRRNKPLSPLRTATIQPIDYY